MARLVNLNADYLLATILSDRVAVRFGELPEIQRRIEQLCPCAVVDVSAPAISSAMEYYPAIFERREREVARASTAEEYLQGPYFEEEFVRSVPQNVHSLVKDAIQRTVQDSDKH